MRVARAAGKCAVLALLWKLAMVENACNVGHRQGRSGLGELDGCHKKGRWTWSQSNTGDEGSSFCMK